MGHITYVRGVGSPVDIIICYFYKNRNHFLIYFFCLNTIVTRHFCCAINLRKKNTPTSVVRTSVTGKVNQK